MPGEITHIENVPVEFELGRPDSVIGMASLNKDLCTGEITIKIVLGKLESGKLESVAKMFELKTIGFAGVKRRVLDGG